MVGSFLGGYGYRAGAISAVFLYQVFCEAFHGGKNTLKYARGYKCYLILIRFGHLRWDQRVGNWPVDFTCPLIGTYKAT